MRYILESIGAAMALNPKSGLRDGIRPGMSALLAIFFLCHCKLSQPARAEETGSTPRLLEIRRGSDANSTEFSEKYILDGEAIYAPPTAELNEKDFVAARLESCDTKLSCAGNPYLPCRDPCTIWLKTTENGAIKFSEMTAKNVNKKVIFLVEGKPVSAPIVRERITNATEISFPYDSQDAHRLVEVFAKTLDSK
jgi:hypothetical protein